MIHLTLIDVGRKTASLRFVAFERSIEAGPASPVSEDELQVGCRNKVSAPGRKHVKKETFKSMRTSRYQRNYPLEVLLAKPRQCELPEVKTVWQI